MSTRTLSIVELISTLHFHAVWPAKNKKGYSEELDKYPLKYLVTQTVLIISCFIATVELTAAWLELSAVS